MYESADKKSAMGIFCTDTPRLRTTKATDEHILDSVRDGVLHNLRGKLLSETPFALGRFPGREVAIKTETQEALGRIVFLRSRGKILTLMALGVDPALAREFVTGVTLVEKASGK
jgi:hypothetical protein